MKAKSLLFIRIAFDIEYGLFEEKEDQTLSPNAHSYLVEDHLK